jgi:hypothetical protein
MDTGLVPDVIFVPVGCDATADATNVTLLNNTTATVSAFVLVEHWHSVERAFGGSGNVTLTPQPIVIPIGALSALGSCGPDMIRTVLPGANKAAEINAAITAMSALYTADGIQRTVQLLCGTYTLETAIVMKNGVLLAGEGDKTILQVTFGGTADDPTNAAIKILGVLDTAKMNTTLSAVMSKDAEALTVAAAGTLAAGDYFMVEGHNTTSNSFGDSDGVNVILREIMRAGTGYAGGAAISTAWPAEQYHASGVTAKAVTPVVNTGVHNLLINAADGTLAVGILMKYALKATFQGISGQGFSRAMFDMEGGAENFVIDGVYCGGETNSIVYCESAMQFEIYRIKCNQEGLRTHAAGIPRGLLHFQSRCTDYKVSDCTLQRGCIGIFYCGGKSGHYENIQIRDMFGDPAFAPWTANGLQPVEAMGVFGGYAPLTIAEFAENIHFSNVTLENCWHASDYDQHTYWHMHDSYELSISACAVYNRGITPNSLTHRQNGIVVADAGGNCEGFTIQGVRDAFRTRGFPSVMFESLIVSGEAGEGVNGDVMFSFEHGGGNNSSGRFRNLIVGGSFQALWRFAGDFLTTPDWYMAFDDFHADTHGRASRGYIAYNNTATVLGYGFLVMLDPASPAGKRYVIVAPADNVTAMASVVGGATPNDPGANAFVIILPLPGDTPAYVLCTTAIVAVGDILVAGPTAFQAQANNGATEFQAIGKALLGKAAGATGIVPIGPA